MSQKLVEIWVYKIIPSLEKTLVISINHIELLGCLAGEECSMML